MISSEQEIQHLLATVALRIRQSLDIEVILQTTVQEVRRLFKCDRVLVYRFNADCSGTVIVESVKEQQYSILGSVVDNPCVESSWIDQYQQGDIVSYEDVSTANISEIHRNLLQKFGVQAILAAPILQPNRASNNIASLHNYGINLATGSSSEQQQLYDFASEKFLVWGLLIAHQCQNPRTWQSLEQDLLKQLANQVAIAIRQAELLQRSIQELKEKKLAQQKTQQVKEFLQNVINHLPVAVYVKDVRQKSFGKFRLWNQATEEIFNIEAPKAIGKTVYDYFSLETAQDFLEQDLTVLKTGETLDVIENYHQEGDRSKIVHKIKVPLYGSNQQIKHLLCIAEDITDRKQSEQELRRKSDELAAFSENLKLLHRLNTTDYQSFAELFKDHLQTGCQMFDCSTGIVGLIKQGVYTVYAVESDLEILVPQQEFMLEETLCLEVTKQRGTVTHGNIGEDEALCYRPVYKNCRFESYIGTPIFVDGKVYGTLSFASPIVKTTPFSDREKETIEMMAQSIGRFIFSDQVEKKRQETAQLLNQTKQELETRVLQRTAELEIANHHLHNELHERQQAQFALQASQDTLRESERRWRSLLENVRLLVVGMDNHGNINYVNPYLLELTGYTRDEVIDQNWFNYFVHPDNQAEAIKVHKGIISANQQDNCCHVHYYHLTTIFTKSREVKTIALNITQLCDLQGNSIGVMCIGEDITKRQAIEKMKDEFISVVSHELRTPLTSIRGALGLLSTGVLSSASEKGERIIKIAAHSTEHLVRLVDDILELERLDSGKIELVIAKIQLQELIFQAVEKVQIFAYKQKIQLQITEVEGEFEGDRRRLVQVLTNLLSNAIKFSDSGSTVQLDAKFEQVEDDLSQSVVVFSVRDRGRGIPQEKLSSIFERFHQVDASDSRRKGGTGLGLAICLSIVEQHGGRIWVESVYGEGTVFYFSLPVSH